MAHPSKKINMQWSGALAYVVGIIAADGNLSPSGRHINIISKDIEIVQNCKEALGIDNKIGRKSRGGELEKKYYVLQFGSVIFYRFLMSIGLLPNKSKTLECVKVPNEFFLDFLRGCIDGDGSIYSFKHPESTHLQVRLNIASASSTYIWWLKKMIEEHTNVRGGWIGEKGKHGAHLLVYAKSDATQILSKVYNTDCHLRLNRKYVHSKKLLDI